MSLLLAGSQSKLMDLLEEDEKMEEQLTYLGRHPEMHLPDTLKQQVRAGARAQRGLPHLPHQGLAPQSLVDTGPGGG